MKGRIHLTLFTFFLVFMLLFNFTNCSKSSKTEGSRSSDSNSSSINNESNNSSNTNGNNGLMITIVGVPQRYNGSNLFLLLTEKEKSDEYIAYSSGDINNGHVDMYLYDFNNEDPWTKIGKYYIKIGSSNDFSPPIEYNLKKSGNTLEYKIIEESKGIKITVINIPDDFGTWVHINLYDKNDYGSAYQKRIARAYGDIFNGSADLYLGIQGKPGENDEPWKKPGEYYIDLDSIGNTWYVYTGGKTLAELGIAPNWQNYSDFLQFPTFFLKDTGNTIDFNKSILPYPRREDGSGGDRN